MRSNTLFHFLRRLPLLVLWGVVSATAFSQGMPCTVTVSGSVSDADEKTPLDKAVLYIKELGLGTETDAEGHYHFYNLCTGVYTFVVTHAHCDTLELRVKVSGNMVRNITLPHHYNQLATVQVLSSKQGQAQQVREELSDQAVAESRGQSLGEVLKRITGVTVLQTGSTIFKPVIHGLHSQRVILINNGVRLEGQQWGSEHAPEIDPYIADRFIVLKGAGAIRYGPDAIGGSVLVEPRALPLDHKTGVEVNTAYFSNNRQYVTNIQVEQNAKKLPAFSWRSHVTFKRGGNARTPDYWLSNTGLRELNASLMAAYRGSGYRAELFLSAFSTDIGIFTGSHIGNLTDLQNAIASARPLQNIDRFSYTIGRPYQQVYHYLGKLRLFWSGNNGQRRQLIVSHQENNRKEYDRALITDLPELSLSIGTTLAELNNEKIKTATRSSSRGAQVMYQQNVWSGSRFFIPNFRNWSLGGYAIEKWQAGDWSMEGALRLDYRSLRVFRNRNGVITTHAHTFFNPSATFSAYRSLTVRSVIRYNASFAWRAPQINEMYVNGLHHGTASFEIGDSSFKAERSLKQVLEWEYQQDSTWQNTLTLHVNAVNDFINLVPSLPPTLTLRGAYPTFRFAQINAILYGADLRTEHQWSRHWKTAVKGSFLWARDQSQRDWLQQMPAHRAEAQLSYAFATPVLQQSYLSLSFLQVMRQTRIPKASVDYLPPPAAYGLLHLNGATALYLNHRLFCHVNVGVNNLLNTRYRDYLNRFRYFNDEVGRNFIVQLKWKL